MSIKLSRAIFFSLAMVAIDAAAAELDDAVDAMHKGDFAKAYCVMQPLAKAGDAEAQYNIGWMYLNGYGLRVDDRQALQWWELASEQGHTDASFSIAMLYNLGEGNVRKDIDKAIDYYLIAASDGQDDAIKILKSMMMRNEKAIRSRMHSIIDQHTALFGTRQRVKVKKLNAREGASVKQAIVTRLKEGQYVLELDRQARWSQVIVLGDETIDRSVWVDNRFIENAGSTSLLDYLLTTIKL